MLDALEPRQFDELLAVARVMPFGDDQATRLAWSKLAADDGSIEYEDLRYQGELDEIECGDDGDATLANVAAVFGVEPPAIDRNGRG